MSEGQTSKVSQPAGAQQAPPGGIKFLHQKAPGFRSIYAHGAWGAWQARNITLSFFNERLPLPAAVIYDMDQNGQILQKEPAIQPSTDAQVVRQFEVEVFMTLDTARIVHTVLGNFINLAEKDPSPLTVR